ncbi:MAG: septum formation initiator family protein [Chloroflexaceae bacterium]|nr:septum formation initiator family protein [Chloroflexaceae bacterium]
MADSQPRRGQRRRSLPRWSHHGLIARIPTIRIPIKQSGIHLVTLVLALLTLSLLMNFINQVIQSANLETRRLELAAQVEQLENETLSLRDSVAYVESDVYVEQIARDQLGYARDNDVVIIPAFVEPTAPTVVPTPVAQPTPPPTLNWKRWWQAFFAKEDSSGQLSGSP